jgi:hypothetical protein
MMVQRRRATQMPITRCNGHRGHRARFHSHVPGIQESSMRITRFATFVFLAVAATSAGAQGPGHRHKKVETQAELQKQAHVTMADARTLALRTVPNSTVQAGEIEREGGKLIYSFDMKVAGKSGIDEVNIDAMSGKLISNNHETPKDERAEAKADAKAAAKAAKSKP